MHFTYRTKGVCSSAIDFDVEGNKVTQVVVTSGCNGNTKGLAALAEGMDVDEVISRLRGIRCGFKPTSCPDQLANALTMAKEKLG